MQSYIRNGRFVGIVKGVFAVFSSEHIPLICALRNGEFDDLETRQL
jgi:hypothetical protein